MPSLLLFNRRTIFAGDDLQPTTLLTTMARLFQLTMLIIPVIVHMAFETKLMLKMSKLEYSAGANLLHYLFGGSQVYPEECSRTSHFFPLLLYIYTFLSMGYFLFSICLEFIIYKLSSVGTPSEPLSRGPLLTKVLERKWIFLSMLGNVVVVIFFFSSFFGFKVEYYECHNIKMQYLRNQGIDIDDNFPTLLGRKGWWVAIFILVGSQCIELVVSTCTLISFLGQPISREYDIIWGQRMSDTDTFQHSYHYHELAEEMWDQRLVEMSNN